MQMKPHVCYHRAVPHSTCSSPQKYHTNVTTGVPHTRYHITVPHACYHMIGVPHVAVCMWFDRLPHRSGILKLLCTTGLPHSGWTINTQCVWYIFHSCCNFCGTHMYNKVTTQV